MMFDEKVGGWGLLNADVSKQMVGIFLKKTFFMPRLFYEHFVSV